jgi:hypothetical protein
MPVHWTISHPSRLVVAVTKDPVTVSDIEKYFAGVTAGGAMGYAKIFEITHTPDALSNENLKALGQRVIFYAEHGQIGPVAIVAASDESYEKAAVFAAAAKVERPLMIFRELHVARHWLEGKRLPANSRGDFSAR